MVFIRDDNDSHACYQEKIDIFEEKWNEIL